MSAMMYTLAGPSSGEVARTSGDFTVTPDAPWTGTITFSDGLTGADVGTFTPASLSWSGTAEPKTFTYTPKTWGEHSITGTSDPVLIDAAPVVYTAKIQLGRTQPFVRVDATTFAGADNENYHTPDFGGYKFCRLGGALADLVRDITADPVHPRSDEMMAIFSEPGMNNPGIYAGGMSNQWYATGMPLSVVDNSQPMVDVILRGGGDEGPPGWSDPGPYPIPPDAGVQEWPILLTPPTMTTPASELAGDSHVVVFNRDTELLYEGYHCRWDEVEGKWSFGNGAIWDMKNGGGGYTADPADPRYCAPGTHRSIVTPIDSVSGLPLLPLAARYDEVARGEITHAIGFTMPNVKIGGSYVWPARGVAYSNWKRTIDEWGLTFPCGVRLRLKQSWYDANVTAHPEWWGPQSTVFLEAFRKYGIILTDGGGTGDLWSVADSRWDYFGDLAALRNVPLVEFEVLDFTVNPAVTVEPDPADPGTPRTLTVTYTYHEGEHPRPIPVNLITDSLVSISQSTPLVLTPASPSGTLTVTPANPGTARYLLYTGSEGGSVVLPTDYFNTSGGLTTTTTGVIADLPTVSAVTATGFTLSLVLSGGTAPYTVQWQKAIAEGIWADEGSSLATSTSPAMLSLTGMEPSTTYYYRARVRDSVASTWATSGWISVTTRAGEQTSESATSYTLTVTSGATVSQPITISATPNGLYSGTITLVPTGGGLSEPVTLTFADSATPQRTTLKPVTAGRLTLEATSYPALSNPTPLVIVVAEVASSYTLLGPPTGLVGTPATFTVQLRPDISLEGPVALATSDANNGGSFNPSIINFTNDNKMIEFEYTAIIPGSTTISCINHDGLIDPAGVLYTAQVGGIHSQNRSPRWLPRGTRLRRSRHLFNGS